jgi:uncharacterized membrane protein YeaQ/YmgE (transglycosylase-associated protein family)
MTRILVSLLAGVILGPLARLLLPGKQNMSALTTVLLGAAGALVGWFLATLGNFDSTRGPDWLQTILSIVLAVVFVGGYAAITGKKQA